MILWLAVPGQLAIPSPRPCPYSGSPTPARVCRRPSGASPCRGGRFRVRLW